MEKLNKLPVSVIDPDGVWPSIEKLISSRLPFAGVKITDFGFKDATLNLKVDFVTSDFSPWLSLQPYVSIYILSFDNFEDYETRLQHDFNDWLKLNSSEACSGIVLYFPVLETGNSSVQAVCRENYGRLKSEIGYASLVRLYSEMLAKYIDLAHPSHKKDEYFTLLLNVLEKKLVASIEKKLVDWGSLIEEQTEEQTALGVKSLVLSDPALTYEYTENLFEVYHFIGKIKKAYRFTKKLIKLADKFPLCNEYSPPSTEMTLDEFRRKLRDQTLTDLEFRLYMLKRKLFVCREMPDIDQTLDVGKKIHKFLIECEAKLKRYGVGDREAASWMHQTSTYFLNVFQYDELYFSNFIARIQAIARGSLEHIAVRYLGVFPIIPRLVLEEEKPLSLLGRSCLECPVLAETQLLKLIDDLIESHRLVGHTNIVAKLQIEKACLLKRKGRTTEALVILLSHAQCLASWPKLSICLKLLKLNCKLALGNLSSAVKLSAKICNEHLSDLPDSTICRLWGIIVNTSDHADLSNNTIFSYDFTITPEIIHQGSEFTVICKLVNPLPFQIDVISISACFVHDRLTKILLTTKNISLLQGDNTISFTGLATIEGEFKNVQFNLEVGRVYLRSPRLPSCLVVNKSFVAIDFKLPSLLMLDQTQLCVMSIETSTAVLSNCVMSLSPASLLDRSARIDYIINSPSISNSVLEINNLNEVFIGDLPILSKCYLLVPIKQVKKWKSPRTSRREIKMLPKSKLTGNYSLTDLFCNDSNKTYLDAEVSSTLVTQRISLNFRYINEDHNKKEIERSLEDSKHFIDPFRISHQFIKTTTEMLVYVQLENWAHIPLTVSNLGIEGAQVIDDSRPGTVTLRTGQKLFQCFVLGDYARPVFTVVVNYGYALASSSLENLVSEDIDCMISRQKFCQRHKILAHDYKLKQIDLVDTLITYTFKALDVRIPYSATIALRKNLNWNLDQSPFDVNSDCEFSVRARSTSSDNTQSPVPFLIVNGEEVDLVIEIA